MLRGAALTGLSVPNAIKRLDGTAITSGTWTVYITKDGGTQTTIAGSVTHEGNGQWTFNLTASEMDAATIALTFTHTDASPYTLVIATDPWVSGTAQAGASTTITLASGASSTDNLYVGDIVLLGDGQCRVITGYVGSTKVATVDRAWTTNPSSSSTYVLLPAAAVLAQQTHTNAVVPTVTNLTNAPSSGDFTATMKASIGTAVAASAVASVTGNVAGSVGSVAAGGITASSIASNAITAAKIATDAIGVAQLASDAVTEIQSGLATASALSTVSSYIDTEVAAIKAKTDNLPAAPAATGDIPSAATIGAQVRTELTTELGRIDAAVSTRATPAQVNAEVVDVIDTDTSAELTGPPAAVSSIRARLGWLFALSRNERRQTATTQSLRNDANSGNIATAGVSDDGTTATRGEWS